MGRKKKKKDVRPTRAGDEEEGGVRREARESTDLLMLEAVDDGLLPILLAAAEAEDAGNLEDLRGEEGP